MGEVFSRTMQVGGRPARVWRGGSGPALLLLHGGLGDAELHWRPVWSALADSFTVAAPDLPGFGGTAPLPAAGYGNFVEWTGAVLETLGFPRAALVGNSFGGAVARLFAARYPVRVTALILVNGGAIRRGPPLVRWLMRPSPLTERLFEWRRRRAAGGSGARRNLARLFSDAAFLTLDFVAASAAAAAGVVATMRETGRSGPPPERTPASPTLVLWGADDRLAPVKVGWKVAQEIPGAEFMLIEKSGHLPQIEQPAAFVGVVRKFCGGR